MLAAIGDEAVEGTIKAEIERINATLGAFYSELIGGSPYSNVALDYVATRVGGIEFSLTWDGREEVQTPHRIMSESQLAALGLALFLAHLRINPPQWRTLVLDDVVTSFDEVHRTRLVRLLEREFAAWQVILLTHDAQLARTVSEEAPQWAALKVTSWTPADGPSFKPAAPLKRLTERLAAGEAADELGGLARQALEQALELPVRQLGLKIRHDPKNVYAADEYRRALLDGLNSGSFPKLDAPVLGRLGTSGSVTNRACHFRDQDPSVTTVDLETLVADLDELNTLFDCDECGEKAWKVRDSRSSRAQCTCGDLHCA